MPGQFCGDWTCCPYADSLQTMAPDEQGHIRETGPNKLPPLPPVPSSSTQVIPSPINRLDTTHRDQAGPAHAHAHSLLPVSPGASDHRTHTREPAQTPSLSLRAVQQLPSPSSAPRPACMSVDPTPWPVKKAAIERMLASGESKQYIPPGPGAYSGSRSTLDVSPATPPFGPGLDRSTEHREAGPSVVASPLIPMSPAMANMPSFGQPSRSGSGRDEQRRREVTSGAGVPSQPGATGRLTSGTAGADPQFGRRAQ